MGLFRRNALRVSSIFLTSHGDSDKVKRGEKDGNRGSTDVLEGA